MNSSPPQEAHEFRGKTLTPVSPKPVHFPSPANIPILEQQMDPMFHESAQVIQSSPYVQNDMSQLYEQPDAHLTNNVYGKDNGDERNQVYNANNAKLNAQDSYNPSAGLNVGKNSSNQDTNYNNDQNFAQQFSIPSASSDLAPGDQAAANTYDPNSASLITPTAQIAQIASPSSASQAEANHGNGTSGALDIQAILDNLNSSASAAPSREEAASASQASNAPGLASPTSTSLPANPNLPPRPPPQEKANTNPNYVQNADIRSYHPHPQSNQTAPFRNTAGLPPLMTAGAAPGTSGFTPMSSAKSAQSPNTPGFRSRESVDRRSETADDEAQWPPEIQRMYDQFLQDERVNVTEGQWDKFPPDSRLFIGQLGTNTDRSRNDWC
jgi:hypothetical protein